MSDLFSLLPDSTSLSGLASSASNTITSYSLADAGTLLNETYSKVTSTFGSAAQSAFSSLSSGTPSFSSLLGTSGKSSTSATAALSAASNSTDTASAIKASSENSDAGSPNNTSHKITLTASASDGNTSAIQNNVNFPVEPLMEARVEIDVMPDLSEQRTVDYEPLSAPQMPVEFQKYKGTKSTQWTISGNFVCRTRDEAKRNYIYINTLRGWTEPYFGDAQRRQFDGKLGAPPPVLLFKGYRGLVGEVPVVLTSFQTNWPHDCDWIPTGVVDSDGQEIPFPTVLQVTINLTESFSPQQVNNFDLVAFRNGSMVGAWPSGNSTQLSQPDVSEATGGNQGSVQGTAQPDPSSNPNYYSTASSNAVAEAPTYTKAASSDNPNSYSTSASNAVQSGGSPDAYSSSDSNATSTNAAPLTTDSTAPAASSADTAQQKADLTRTVNGYQTSIGVMQNQLTGYQNQLALATKQGDTSMINYLNGNIDGVNRNIAAKQADLATYQSQLAALG